MLGHYRKLAGDVMDLLPTHREPAQSLEALATVLTQRHRDITPGEAQGVVGVVMALLDIFGVLETTVGTGAYRTRNQLSTYFVRSLCWFVEHSVALLGNWSTKGASDHIAPETLLEHPAYFLRLLERRRMQVAMEQGLNVTPTRRQSAVSILIKGLLDGETYYLHRYDAHARQFQTIGGRIEPGEAPRDAAVRELVEEMGPSFDIPLVEGHNMWVEFALDPAEPIRSLLISQTYGALTDYTFYVCAVHFDTPVMHLGADDCWLTVDEMLHGRTRTGRAMSDPRIFEQMDQRISGGLRHAPLPTVDIRLTPHFEQHLGL